MSEIHDRMPVILSRPDEQSWLDPEITTRQTLSSLLKAYPDSRLDIREVSTLVNSTKNNSPTLLDPPTKLNRIPRLFE
jgi:putative SOS response-associated peptidase YedK